MKESGRQLSDGPWPGLGQAPLKQQQPVFPEAHPSHTVFAKALLWSVCPPHLTTAQSLEEEALLCFGANPSTRHQSTCVGKEKR